MKARISLALALPLAGAATARADDPVAHPPTAVAVDTIYAPDGFDDNDEAQVVVEGHLPSTCYRVSHAVSAVDALTHKVTVTQYARRFAGPCIPDAVPFFSEVSLGELHSGRFLVKARGAASEALSVHKAFTSTPDDFPYAQVDAARVETDADGSLVAVLNGRLTNRCQTWDEVRVLNQGKVIVLQPILANAGGRGCDAGEQPFERRVALPAELAVGRHLLHVRSLSGKAVNVLFDAGR
jgi:hypothetical protein